jgi:hypothetical protein
VKNWAKTIKSSYRTYLKLSRFGMHTLAFHAAPCFKTHPNKPLQGSYARQFSLGR